MFMKALKRMFDLDDEVFYGIRLFVNLKVIMSIFEV